MSLTFSKSERILKSRDFLEVYKKGRRNHGKYFYISFTSGNQKALGITVSSKVGPAHQRNRIKRVIREAYRLNKEKFPEGKMILTAKLKTAQLTNGEIRKKIFDLVGKIK